MFFTHFNEERKKLIRNLLKLFYFLPFANYFGPFRHLNLWFELKSLQIRLSNELASLLFASNWSPPVGGTDKKFLSLNFLLNFFPPLSWQRVKTTKRILTSLKQFITRNPKVFFSPCAYADVRLNFFRQAAYCSVYSSVQIINSVKLL